MEGGKGHEKNGRREVRREGGRRGSVEGEM